MNLLLKPSKNYLLLTEFEVRTVSYGPSFSSSFYGPSAKRAGHKSCVSDEFRNDFYSIATAWNFWSRSKAKGVNLKSFWSR